MFLAGYLSMAFIAHAPGIGRPATECYNSGDKNIPPTPCTRICRYNADFYDGQVCIGCFREVYEIANWSSMSNVERMYALMDAADRGEGVKFEGAISQDELMRQAKGWGKMKE